VHPKYRSSQPSWTASALRFRSASKISLLVCKLHYRFSSLQPSFRVTKAFYKSPMILCSCTKARPSRGRTVQGKSRTKNKKGYCEWCIRFIHPKVMSFWHQLWKRRTVQPQAVSWGIGRNKKEKSPIPSNFHHFSICLCIRLLINSKKQHWIWLLQSIHLPVPVAARSKA
jgi:hypothetical protein